MGDDRPAVQAAGWQRRLAACLVGLLLLLAGCGTTLATPVPVSLRLVAAEGVLPLAQDLVTAYQTREPHVSIRVEATANSAAAAHWLQQGRGDLALLAGQPPAEANGMAFRHLAWDAVAIVVNPDNGLEHLSLSDAGHVFSGRIEQWSQLDPAGEGIIQIITREEGATTRTTLETGVMDGASIVPTAIVVASNHAMSDSIAANQQAIGYLPASLVDGRVRPLWLDGLAADGRTAIRAGYPLVQPIQLATAAEGMPEVQAFLAFVASREGQEVVAMHYGLP